MGQKHIKAYYWLRRIRRAKNSTHYTTLYRYIKSYLEDNNPTSKTFINKLAYSKCCNAFRLTKKLPT